MSRDDAPTKETHDDFCERMEVDIGVGSMHSPCGCLERDRDSLRAQLAEVLRDAARYRWLRDHVDMECGVLSFEYSDYGDGDKLDAAIDAALPAAPDVGSTDDRSAT